MSITKSNRHWQSFWIVRVLGEIGGIECGSKVGWWMLRGSWEASGARVGRGGGASMLIAPIYEYHKVILNT
jgi:hypothetical protein